VIRTIASQHINYLDRFWDLYQKLPYETARYVPRFLATLVVIRDPQKYGIDLGAGAGKISALSYEIAEINKSMRLQDIARKLDISEEVLNILNAELRHDGVKAQNFVSSRCKRGHLIRIKMGIREKDSCPLHQFDRDDRCWVSN
jgi:hypothetical protein